MIFKQLPRKYKMLLPAIMFAVTLCFDGRVFAQDNAEVSTILTPHSSDAIFSDKASYTFSVKNTYPNAEVGRVSYIVTDQFNKTLLKDSVHVTIGAKSTKDLDFTIPE